MANVFGLPDQATIDALGVYQGWWNGLTFGEGTDHMVEGNIEGLLAYDSRISDVPIPQRDGDITFGRWASGRIVSIPFLLLGLPSTHDAVKDAWVLAFSANDPYLQEWLAFKTPSNVHLVRGRVVRRQIELSPEVGRAFRSHSMVELKLADPRVYDGLAWVQDLIVPIGAAVGGGFELPEVELPIEMTTPVGGVSVANNPGNVTAYPLIRVENTGGTNITSVTITNVTHAEVVDVNAIVAPGQTLNIDFDAMIRAEVGPHIHIDGASRYGDWSHPRVMLGIHPGSNTITAEHTGGTAVVRLDWLLPTL